MGCFICVSFTTHIQYLPTVLHPLLQLKTCNTQLPFSLIMNNSEINIDLKVVCNAYVLTEVMLGPYHTEILENLQQAQDLEYKSKFFLKGSNVGGADC